MVTTAHAPRPSTILAAQAAGAKNISGRLAGIEAGVRARTEISQTEAARASVELEEALGLFQLAVALGDGQEADRFGGRLLGLRAAVTAARKELAAAKAAADGKEVRETRALLSRAERELRRLQEEEAARQAASQNRAAAAREEEALASYLGRARARQVMAAPARRPTAPAPAAAPAAPARPTLKVDGLAEKWGVAAK